MITQHPVARRAVPRPPASSRPAARVPRAVRRPARLALALLVILAFVSPIYLTVVNAFKTNAAIAGSPGSLPVHPTLGNLSTALTQPGHVLEIGLRNSLIVVVCSVALLILLGSAFSFWISRKRTRARAAVMAAFAVGLMIPPQITVLPVIKILAAIGLDHTYPGLILSNLGGGYLSFAVFVYVGFMRSIPAEVVEAARIDGASGLRIWWTIIMPLVRPATATVGIFLSLWIWNDFLNPLLIIGPITGQTVTVGLYDAVSNQVQPDYGLQFGFMFLAAVVPVAGYLLAQKQFRRRAHRGVGPMTARPSRRRRRRQSDRRSAGHRRGRRSLGRRGRTGAPALAAQPGRPGPRQRRPQLAGVAGRRRRTPSATTPGCCGSTGRSCPRSGSAGSPGACSASTPAPG